jgi:hypothetical protein
VATFKYKLPTSAVSTLKRHSSHALRYSLKPPTTTIFAACLLTFNCHSAILSYRICNSVTTETKTVYMTLLRNAIELFSIVDWHVSVFIVLLPRENTKLKIWILLYLGTKLASLNFKEEKDVKESYEENILLHERWNSSWEKACCLWSNKSNTQARYIPLNYCVFRVGRVILLCFWS